MSNGKEMHQLTPKHYEQERSVARQIRGTTVAVQH